MRRFGVRVANSIQLDCGQGVRGFSQLSFEPGDLFSLRDDDIVELLEVVFEVSDVRFKPIETI